MDWCVRGWARSQVLYARLPVLLGGAPLPQAACRPGGKHALAVCGGTQRASLHPARRQC